MNNKVWLKKAVLLFCLAMPIESFAATAKDPDNPKPVEGDLVLPIPGGGSMVFRPVFLDIGDAPYATREYKMGDRREGGYKEYPTAVQLAGSFRGDNNGRNDWLYYIGKYEVTQKQYQSVMGGDEPSKTDAAKPVNRLSWFDAQIFMQKYNAWLGTEARDALPELDGKPGFIRLPTEEEWEFAARGGSAVKPGTFDKTHPYSGKIIRYEWYSGPKSSHDKLKKTGLLKANPLGIHDMLGNVAEMTASMYRIEYYQGRSGGFTARGGHFRTPGKKLRSSMRTERPFYKEDGTPSKQKELGFRLAIGAPVFAGRNMITELEEGWENYRKIRPTPGSAALSTSSTSARTTYSLNDARKEIDRIDATAKQNNNEELQNSVTLLRTAMGDVQAMILKAERESAIAWTRMASYYALQLNRNSKKLPLSEKLLEMSKARGSANVAQLEKRHKDLLANIDELTNQYALSMGELGKVDAEQVRNGFTEFERKIIASGLAEQLRIHKLVEKQYTDYEQNKRLNLDAWIEQLKKH